MRIPPYYKSTLWQRFFSGMVIGGIISWFIFLYIYGEWLEEYSMEINKQADTIRDLEDEKKIWQEDVEKLNQKNEEKLKIQKIEVKITNYEKYKLDLYSVYEVEESVREDIKTLLAKDIETAYTSSDLVQRTIENKIFKVHDKRYRLVVKQIVFYTTVSIKLQIQLEN